MDATCVRRRVVDAARDGEVSAPAASSTPWELALVDPKLQDEIYGTDPDTWVASPYAPHGLAKPVDGGFLFSGEWQYSTGTDHCDGIILGGMVTDADGDIDGIPDVASRLRRRVDHPLTRAVLA